MKNHLLDRHRNERGVALILTLAIMVLVTLLVVSFAISMRVESAASKAYSDQVKAREFAMAGVNEAIALLRAGTPRLGGSTNYVTFPGLIVARTNNTTTGPAVIPLYTTGNTNDFCDLNFGFRGLVNRHSSTVRKMAVAWRDWGLFGAVPWTGKSNLVGRYAYWIDDEATKININAACQRTDFSDPSTKQIDLTPLLPVGTINGPDSYNARPYLTPYSWPRPGKNAITALICSTNMFNITTYSQDVQLTPWGAPRLNLNTNLSNATAKLALWRAITNMLQNVALTNWFYAFGSGGQTFREKYSESNVWQIAANIVDYISIGNIPMDDVTAQPEPKYLGLKETPYMNELVTSNWFNMTTNGNWLIVEAKCSTIMELWYMYPPPAPDYDLSGLTITIKDRPSIRFMGGTLTFPSSVSVPASGTMLAQPWSGTYRLFTIFDGYLKLSNSPPAPVVVNFNSGTITAILKDGAGNRLDYASIRMTNYSMMLLPTGANLDRPINTNCVSACVDPRVKPVSKYWNPVGGGGAFGKGTLGAFNNGTVYYGTDIVHLNTNPVNGVILMRDGDWTCVTGMVASANRGTISSVGELGFIHTGLPWRTLRLGPQEPIEKTAPNPLGLIPDWAVLDLFTTTTNKPVAGRININSQVYVCTNIVDMVPGNIYPRQLSASQARRAPLQALYYPTFNSTYANYIMFRIWTNRVLIGGVSADNIYTPPDSWHPFTNCYAMIGQICEVRNIADNLVSGGSKAAREARVRTLANLLTTRSNAFSIWVVGQAIADANKDGVYQVFAGDEILSEVIVHAVVERYEDSTNQVRFRIRNIHYYTN